MAISVLLAPAPNHAFGALPSGSVYLADPNGLIIQNYIPADDITALQAAGCVVMQPVVTTNLIGSLRSADFHVTTDQPIGLPGVAISARYRVTKVTVENTSAPGMSTAAGGIYTGAAKTGSQIVAAGQVYTGLTDANTALDLTLNLPSKILLPATPLIFSLTTAHGSAATADINVFGDVYAA